MDGRARVARRGGAGRARAGADRAGVRAPRSSARSSGPCSAGSRRSIGHRVDVRRRRASLGSGSPRGRRRRRRPRPSEPQPLSTALGGGARPAHPALASGSSSLPALLFGDARRARAAAAGRARLRRGRRSARSGSSPACSRRGTTPLVGRVSDRRGPARCRSASALGRLGDRAAAPAVARRALRARALVIVGAGSRSAPSTRPACHPAHERGRAPRARLRLRASRSINLAWAPGQAVGAALGGAVADVDLGRGAVPRRSARSALLTLAGLWRSASSS